VLKLGFYRRIYMALWIYTSDSALIETLFIESRVYTSGLKHVSAVIASNFELDRALKITGFPQYGRVMSFHGDMAKHIVSNWFN
jgi:hypothetical protein